MSAITRSPQNTTPLQATKFLLTFARIPNTQYFCQEVNIPGVSLGEVDRVTPFLDMFLPGTKLKYDPLDISYIVDAELQSWKDMYNWFTSIANPEGFEGRVKNYDSDKSNHHYSDAILTVLSPLNNPVIRIEYSHVFPLSMSDIQFDTKLSADNIITCRATFRYQSYRYLTV